MGGGKHVFPEQGDELWGDLGQVFANKNAVVGEEGDLTKLLGDRDRLGDFGSKRHGGFSHVNPVLAINGGTEGFVDEPQVFVTGVGHARLGPPFAVVVPPAVAQFLKVVAGQLGESFHPVPPVVIVKDIVHVENKKHDGQSLGPSPWGSRVPSNYTEGVGPLIVDCRNPDTRASGVAAAHTAVTRGELIVIPTDTVYGVACDAFSSTAVNTLLACKGRGRHMPPPVLVASPDDVEALVHSIPSGAKAVMDAFWPGAVTIVFRANSSLEWDLGETGDTVALRMPDHVIALDVLAVTGPLAVSSANKTGEPAAHTAAEALSTLGDAVSVYLEGGSVGQSGRLDGVHAGSTIIDASALDSGGPWRVVRYGAQPVDSLRAVAQGRWES